MKIIKTANGKKQVKISKKEWESIGKKAGWMKEAQQTRGLEMVSPWGDVRRVPQQPKPEPEPEYPWKRRNQPEQEQEQEPVDPNAKPEVRPQKLLVSIDPEAKKIGLVGWDFGPSEEELSQVLTPLGFEKTSSPNSSSKYKAWYGLKDTSKDIDWDAVAEAILKISPEEASKGSSALGSIFIST